MRRAALSIAAIVSLGGMLTGCADAKDIAVDCYVNAYLLQEQGRLDAAMAQLNQATRLDGGLTVAYSLKGDILMEQGRPAEAADSYEQATVLNPNDLHSHFHLGLAYQTVSRFTEAARAYLRATQIDPEHFDSQFKLGTVYETLQRYPEAAERYTIAIEIRPEDALAHYHMAAVSARLGNPQNAIREYKDALEAGTQGPQIWLSLGRAYIQAGDFTNAVGALERAQAAEPNSLAVLQQLAYARYRLVRLDAAEADYRRILGMEPNNWDAINGLGGVQMSRFLADPTARHFQEDALALWEKSLKLNPNQPQVAQLLERYRNLPALQIDPRTGLPKDPRAGG
jgi:tetratricopeptide (TPR) repeat protein